MKSRRHDGGTNSRSSPITTEPGTPLRKDRSEIRAGQRLRIILADLPERPLVSASWVIRNGAVDSRPANAGATSSQRAPSRGTEHYDAISLVEAGERPGASLHAEAGWDAMSVKHRRPGDAP